MHSESKHPAGDLKQVPHLIRRTLYKQKQGVALGGGGLPCNPGPREGVSPVQSVQHSLLGAALRSALDTAGTARLCFLPSPWLNLPGTPSIWGIQKETYLKKCLVLKMV